MLYTVIIIVVTVGAPRSQKYTVALKQYWCWMEDIYLPAFSWNNLNMCSVICAACEWLKHQHKNITSIIVTFLLDLFIAIFFILVQCKCHGTWILFLISLYLNHVIHCTITGSCHCKWFLKVTQYHGEKENTASLEFSIWMAGS